MIYMQEKKQRPIKDVAIVTAIIHSVNGGTIIEIEKQRKNWYRRKYTAR
jgi:hypothetical protein